MKVLSVVQPFAWAIVQGIKDVENRSRRTHHRGPLLIHSSRKWDDVAELADGTKPPPVDELVFGAILGLVELVDCVPQEKAPKSPFANGPWCWVFRNPVILAEPFVTPGKWGFGTPRQSRRIAIIVNTPMKSIGGNANAFVRNATSGFLLNGEK